MCLSFCVLLERCPRMQDSGCLSQSTQGAGRRRDEESRIEDTESHRGEKEGARPSHATGRGADLARTCNLRPRCSMRDGLSRGGYGMQDAGFRRQRRRILRPSIPPSSWRRQVPHLEVTQCRSRCQRWRWVRHQLVCLSLLCRRHSRS